MKRAVRLAVVALVALGLMAGGFVIATTSPTRDSIYPKCITYTATGLHCPGCGTGRASHFLLNGRLLDALQCNLFAPFILPFFLVALFRSLLIWALDRPFPEPRIRALWLRLLAAALIIYTVARNIPAEPFNQLAPREVEPVTQASHSLIAR
ncbi:DUF2752 domain-containing protein [Frigoriglobus tundricola]|uniref:DUF2752 domain-containing protein n=1 Tax=Frigoriglobus tundricola TaxID=2774151 RepID=A0A6M5YN97_9BACT|nr:DUF2752 domain-containing protein [Frigoriglobus tundricola]QJW94432.1 hypothetical protein FTUN_1952 [Frigoriglobus tundricola]